MCFCVFHANVGVCGCELHTARRHGAGEEQKKRTGAHLPHTQEARPVGVLRGFNTDLSPLLQCGSEAGTWPQRTCL